MTNDKGAEYEKLATEIVGGNYGLDFERALTEAVTQALSEAHAAGRQSAIAEVMPVLEFTTHATEHLFGKVYPQPNMCPTFYHTLTYEGDVELVDKCKQARALLERIKNG